MKYTLGFSPCPNDTFIFDALVNKKIDTQNVDFEVVLEDVQTLNQWALEEKLDVSKISYGVLPLVQENYTLLNSGGALGKGVGPLLITHSAALENHNINAHSLVAIPGKNTTAHLLFAMAYPHHTHKKFMVFNEIEDAVLNKMVDAGVIIHENRFTYQQRGLKKIIDLGEYWEEKLKIPIPLGGIVAHKRVEESILSTVDELIKKSIEFAFANYPSITDYVKQHAQEMDESIMKQHIDLYVNNYSLDIGNDGKKAVEKLMDIHHLLSTNKS